MESTFYVFQCVTHGTRPHFFRDRGAVERLHFIHKGCTHQTTVFK